MPFDSLKNQNNFFSVLVADLIAKGGINTTGYSDNLAKLILDELDNIVLDPGVALDLDLRTEDIKIEYETNLHPILLSLVRTKEILIDTRARVIGKSQHQQVEIIKDTAQIIATSMIDAYDAGHKFGLSGGWEGQGAIQGHAMAYISSVNEGDFIHCTSNTGGGIQYHPKRPGIDKHGKADEYYTNMADKVKGFLPHAATRSPDQLLECTQKLTTYVYGLIEPNFSPYFQDGGYVIDAHLIYSDRISRLHSLGHVIPVAPEETCISPRSTPGQRSGTCVGRIIVNAIDCNTTSEGNLNKKLIYILKYKLIKDQCSQLKRFIESGPTPSKSDIITAAKLLEFAIADLCRRQTELAPVSDEVFARHYSEFKVIKTYIDQYLAPAALPMILRSPDKIRISALLTSGATILIDDDSARPSITLIPVPGSAYSCELGLDPRHQYPLRPVAPLVNCSEHLSLALQLSIEYAETNDSAHIIEVIEKTMLDHRMADPTFYTAEKTFLAHSIGKDIIATTKLLQLYVEHCNRKLGTNALDGTRAITILSFIVTILNLNDSGPFGHEKSSYSSSADNNSLLSLFASPFFYKFYDSLKTSPILATGNAQASSFFEEVVKYFEGTPAHSRSRRERLLAQTDDKSNYSASKNKHRYKTISQYMNSSFSSLFTALESHWRSIPGSEKGRSTGDDRTEQVTQVILDSLFSDSFLAANATHSEQFLEAKYIYLYETLMQLTLTSAIDIMHSGFGHVRAEFCNKGIPLAFQDITPGTKDQNNILAAEAIKSLTSDTSAHNGFEWITYSIYYSNGSRGSSIQAGLRNSPCLTYSKNPDLFTPGIEILPARIFSCTTSNLAPLQALSWHILADCTYGREAVTAGIEPLMQKHLEIHPSAGSSYMQGEAQMLKYRDFRDTYYESNKLAINVLKQLKCVSSSNAIVAEAIALRSHIRLQVESTLDFLGQHQNLVGDSSFTVEERTLWRNLCLYNILHPGLITTIARRQIASATPEIYGKPIVITIRDVALAGLIHFSPRNIATEPSLFYLQISYCTYKLMYDDFQQFLNTCTLENQSVMAAKVSEILAPYKVIFEDRLDDLIINTKNKSILANLHLYRKLYLHHKLAFDSGLSEGARKDSLRMLGASSIISSYYPKAIETEFMMFINTDEVFFREQIAELAADPELSKTVIQRVMSECVPQVAAIVAEHESGNWVKSTIAIDTSADLFHYEYVIEQSEHDATQVALVRISLESGSIFLGSNTVVGPVPAHFRINPIYHQLLGSLNPTCTMNASRTIVDVQNGTDRYLIHKLRPTVDPVIQKIITINGVTNPYELISLGRKRTFHPNQVLGEGLPRIICEKSNQGWISIDGAPTNELIVVDSRDSKILYRYDYTTKTLRMLDPDGNDSGYQLVNNTDGIYNILEHFENPELVLVWRFAPSTLNPGVTSHLGQIYIQFPRYDMAFIGNHDPIDISLPYTFALESDREYLLNLDHLPTVIYDFPHALRMHLKNKPSEKLIIPRSQFFMTTEELETDMYHGRKYDTGYELMHRRIGQVSSSIPDSENDRFPPQYSRTTGKQTNFLTYTYQIVNGNKLISSSPQANLQLVYIYLTKSQYKQALQCLRDCPTLEGNPLEAETIYWILDALTFKPFESNTEGEYIYWKRYQPKTPELGAIQTLLCAKVLKDVFYSHSSFNIEELTSDADTADPMMHCREYLASRLHNMFNVEGFNKILSQTVRCYVTDSPRLSADMKLTGLEIEKLSLWLHDHKFNIGVFAALYRHTVLDSATTQLTKLLSIEDASGTTSVNAEVLRLKKLIASENTVKVVSAPIIEIVEKEYAIKFPIAQIIDGNYFMHLYNPAITRHTHSLSRAEYLTKFGHNFENLNIYFKRLFDYVVAPETIVESLEFKELHETIANNIRAAYRFHTDQDIDSHQTEESKVMKEATLELSKILFVLMQNKISGILAVSENDFGFKSGSAPSNESGKENFLSLLDKIKDPIVIIDVPVQTNTIETIELNPSSHLAITMADPLAPAKEFFKQLTYEEVESYRPPQELNIAQLSKTPSLGEIHRLFVERTSNLMSRATTDSGSGQSFVAQMKAHLDNERELGIASVEEDIAFRKQVIDIFGGFVALNIDDDTHALNFTKLLDENFISPLDEIVQESKGRILEIFHTHGITGAAAARMGSGAYQEIDFDKILLLSIFASPEIYNRFNQDLDTDACRNLYEESLRYIQHSLLLQRYKRANSELSLLMERINEINGSTPWEEDYKCCSLLIKACTQLFHPDYSTELLKLLNSSSSSSYEGLFKDVLSERSDVAIQAHPTMFATLAYFQYLRSVLLRDEQLSYLVHMQRVYTNSDNPSQVVSAVYQMIMGFGKSKMIAPMKIVFTLMSNPGSLMVVEVPESLLHTFAQDVDAQTKPYGHRAEIFRVNRDTIRTAHDLKMICHTLEAIKARGNYIITDGTSIPALSLMEQAIILEKPLGIAEDSSEYFEWKEKVTWCDKIMALIENVQSVLMDEYDDLRNPLSKFIFSFTQPQPIESTRAKWNTRMMLSLEYVDISTIVGETPGTYNFLEVIRRKHPDRASEPMLLDSTEKWDQAMDAIAEFLVTSPNSPLDISFFDSSSARSSMIMYLRDSRQTEKPECYIRLPKNMKEQLDLYYAYLNKLLKFTVIEKGNYLVQNGPIDKDSADPIKRMISKPYKGADAPDTSDWGNTDTLMIFSLFNLIILGLRDTDIKRMIDNLRFISLEEIQQHPERKPEETQPAIDFATMYDDLKNKVIAQQTGEAVCIVKQETIAGLDTTIGKALTYLASTTLGNIDVTDANFTILCRVLANNMAFNEYFFVNPHGIAKHIHTMGETLECTAAKHDLCFGNKGLGMSGDPWNASAANSEIERADKSVGFGTTGRILRIMREAQLVETCDSTDPYKVLEYEVQKIKELNHSDPITAARNFLALIDLEARFKGKTNLYCSNRFADYFKDHHEEHSSIKYIIFLKSFRDKSGIIQKLYALNVESREEIKLDTSNYDDIKRLLGVDCDSWFVYFSQFGGTRGLDVKLTPGAIFVLLINGEAKLYEVEQAALRAREIATFSQKLVISTDSTFRQKALELDPDLDEREIIFRDIEDVTYRNQLKTLETLNVTGCIDMQFAIASYYYTLLSRGQEPEVKSNLSALFKCFITSTTSSDLSVLYGTRPKEENTGLTFERIRNAIIKDFSDAVSRIPTEIRELTLKCDNTSRICSREEAISLNIGSAAEMMLVRMNEWITKEIKLFIKRCPEKSRLAGNSGADSQVTIQHQINTQKQIDTRLQQEDPRAVALPEDNWIESLGLAGRSLYDLSLMEGASSSGVGCAAGGAGLGAGVGSSITTERKILPLEDIFVGSTIGDRTWSFEPGMKTSVGFMLTTTAHRDGSSRLDAYAKQIQYMIFKSSDRGGNSLDCILLSKNESDRFIMRIFENGVNVPVGQHFWIERITGNKCIGRFPDNDALKETNYYQLLEQARVLGGNIHLLSRQKAPLIWLMKETESKMKFLEDTILPKHYVEPTDLDNLHRRVSVLSKYYDTVASNPDELMAMTDSKFWARFPDIEEEDRVVLTKMALLFIDVTKATTTSGELFTIDDWTAAPHSFPAPAVTTIKEFIRRAERTLKLTEILTDLEGFHRSTFIGMIQKIYEQNPLLANKVLNLDIIDSQHGVIEYAGTQLSKHLELWPTIFNLITFGAKPKIPASDAPCSVMHKILIHASDENLTILPKHLGIALEEAMRDDSPRVMQSLNEFFEALLIKDSSQKSSLTIFVERTSSFASEVSTDLIQQLVVFCNDNARFRPYLERIIQDQGENLFKCFTPSSKAFHAVENMINTLAFERWSPDILNEIINMKPELALIRDPRNGMNILHRAVLENSSKLIVTILSQAPDAANVLDTEGRTPIALIQDIEITRISQDTRSRFEEHQKTIIQLERYLESDNHEGIAKILQQVSFANCYVTETSGGLGFKAPLILVALIKNKLESATTILRVAGEHLKLDCVHQKSERNILHLLTMMHTELNDSPVQLDKFLDCINLDELITLCASSKDVNTYLPIDYLIESATSICSLVSQKLITKLVHDGLQNGYIECDRIVDLLGSIDINQMDPELAKTIILSHPITSDDNVRTICTLHDLLIENDDKHTPSRFNMTEMNWILFERFSSQSHSIETHKYAGSVILPHLMKNEDNHLALAKYLFDLDTKCEPDFLELFAPVVLSAIIKKPSHIPTLKFTLTGRTYESMMIMSTEVNISKLALSKEAISLLPIEKFTKFNNIYASKGGNPIENINITISELYASTSTTDYSLYDNHPETINFLREFMINFNFISDHEVHVTAPNDTYKKALDKCRTHVPEFILEAVEPLKMLKDARVHGKFGLMNLQHFLDNDEAAEISYIILSNMLKRLVVLSADSRPLHLVEYEDLEPMVRLYHTYNKAPIFNIRNRINLFFNVLMLGNPELTHAMFIDSDITTLLTNTRGNVEGHGQISGLECLYLGAEIILSDRSIPDLQRSHILNNICSVFKKIPALIESGLLLGYSTSIISEERLFRLLKQISENLDSSSEELLKATIHILASIANELYSEPNFTIVNDSEYLEILKILDELIKRIDATGNLPLFLESIEYFTRTTCIRNQSEYTGAKCNKSKNEAFFDAIATTVFSCAIKRLPGLDQAPNEYTNIVEHMLANIPHIFLCNVRPLLSDSARTLGFGESSLDNEVGFLDSVLTSAPTLMLSHLSGLHVPKEDAQTSDGGAYRSIIMKTFFRLINTGEIDLAISLLSNTQQYEYTPFDVLSPKSDKGESIIATILKVYDSKYDAILDNVFSIALAHNADIKSSAVNFNLLIAKLTSALKHFRTDGGPSERAVMLFSKLFTHIPPRLASSPEYIEELDPFSILTFFHKIQQLDDELLIHCINSYGMGPNFISILGISTASSTKELGITNIFRELIDIVSSEARLSMHNMEAIKSLVICAASSDANILQSHGITADIEKSPLLVKLYNLGLYESALVIQKTVAADKLFWQPDMLSNIITVFNDHTPEYGNTELKAHSEEALFNLLEIMLTNPQYFAHMPQCISLPNKQYACTLTFLNSLDLILGTLRFSEGIRSSRLSHASTELLSHYVQAMINEHPESFTKLLSELKGMNLAQKNNPLDADIYLAREINPSLIFKQLLDNFPNGQNALHMCIAKQNPQLTKDLVHLQPLLLFKEDTDGVIPLTQCNQSVFADSDCLEIFALICNRFLCTPDAFDLEAFKKYIEINAVIINEAFCNGSLNVEMLIEIGDEDTQNILAISIFNSITAAIHDGEHNMVAQWCERHLDIVIRSGVFKEIPDALGEILCDILKDLPDIDINKICSLIVGASPSILEQLIIYEASIHPDSYEDSILPKLIKALHPIDIWSDPVFEAFNRASIDKSSNFYRGLINSIVGISLDRRRITIISKHEYIGISRTMLELFKIGQITLVIELIDIIKGSGEINYFEISQKFVTSFIESHPSSKAERSNMYETLLKFGAFNDVELTLNTISAVLEWFADELYPNLASRKASAIIDEVLLPTRAGLHSKVVPPSYSTVQLLLTRLLRYHSGNLSTNVGAADPNITHIFSIMLEHTTCSDSLGATCKLLNSIENTDVLRSVLFTKLEGSEHTVLDAIHYSIIAHGIDITPPMAIARLMTPEIICAPTVSNYQLVTTCALNSRSRLSPLDISVLTKIQEFAKSMVSASAPTLMSRDNLAAFTLLVGNENILSCCRFSNTSDGLCCYQPTYEAIKLNPSALKFFPNYEFLSSFMNLLAENIRASEDIETLEYLLNRVIPEHLQPCIAKMKADGTTLNEVSYLGGTIGTALTTQRAPLARYAELLESQLEETCTKIATEKLRMS